MRPQRAHARVVAAWHADLAQGSSTGQRQVGRGPLAGIDAGACGEEPVQRFDDWALLPKLDARPAE